MTNEWIALIANLALTLSFIIALIFGIMQVKTADRDGFTLERLHSFETREFAELLNHVIFDKMPSTYSEWLKTTGSGLSSLASKWNPWDPACRQINQYGPGR